MRESTITCPETINNRNGTPVPFDIKKISSAIHKANDAAMVEAISPLEFEKLVTEIVESIPHGQIPNVEQIRSCGREADRAWLCQDSKSIYSISGRAYQSQKNGSRSGKYLPGTYIYQRG